MADTTINTSTLQGYVATDLDRLLAREDRQTVAGDMAQTYQQIAEFDRRLQMLESIAQKLIGG